MKKKYKLVGIREDKKKRKGVLAIMEKLWRSGKYTFHKLTKTQVKKAIREKGTWTGLLAGNKTSPYHFLEGWCLAHLVTITTLDELERVLSNMLYYLSPKLGNRIAFFEII